MDESSPENHSDGRLDVEEDSSGEKMNLFVSQPWQFELECSSAHERSDGAAIGMSHFFHTPRIEVDNPPSTGQRDVADQSESSIELNRLVAAGDINKSSVVVLLTSPTVLAQN